MKHLLLAAVFALSLSTAAEAQERYGPDRVFSYFDRDKNGILDRGEFDRFPDSMKKAAYAARLDFRRGVDKASFTRSWETMAGEMRAQRDQEASRRDYGSSSRGGDSRRPEQRTSSPPPKPTSKRPPKRKPRGRVTVDLPTRFTEVDKNKDGQIGLYEWDRAKFREFFAMDRNGDGFLTPRELAMNPTAQPSSSTSRTSSNRTPSTRTPSTPASPKTSSNTSTSSSSITPVKYDPNSSDGRRASFVFKALDKNKDGSLTAEEWERSQSTRRDFERKKVKLPTPASLEQFAGLYLAIRKAR